MKKVMESRRLSGILGRLRFRGKKIVFTNGCFDILHKGHIRYLKKAASLGDVLVIGLNSDRSVRAIKGSRRPINCELDRAEILAALDFVDYVTFFDEETPQKLIEVLKPDILVKGGDWKIKDIVGADFIKSRGGRIVRIPFIKGYSTSLLVERLLDEKK